MINDDKINPERFKDLAFSHKDLAVQERQSRQKLLRILRELDARLTRIENILRTP